MAQLLIQVPDKLKAQFKLVCALKKTGMTQILIKCIQDYINKNKETIEISTLFDD